jgi:hypothetical protein
MKKAEEKRAQESKRPRRSAKAPAKRIAELLWVIEEKLRDNGFKPTVADFIRLLQLHKEFEAQQPRNIEVTWIDPPTIQTDAA